MDHPSDDDRSPSVDRTNVLELPNGNVTVLGTVKGLVSERKLVQKIFRASRPEVVGLHIGKEEISGLKAVVKGKVENTYLSSYEKVYARELSKYGEVMIPPPSLVEAYEVAKSLDIPVKALDFDETNYATIYTEMIDGVTMIRQSLRLKSINKKKFKAENAEEFVIEWDRLVNRYKGFRKLEAKREAKIAKRIRSLSDKYGDVLAIVEFERMEGIVKILSER